MSFTFVEDNNNWSRNIRENGREIILDIPQYHCNPTIINPKYIPILSENEKGVKSGLGILQKIELIKNACINFHDNDDNVFIFTDTRHIFNKPKESVMCLSSGNLNVHNSRTIPYSSAKWIYVEEDNVNIYNGDGTRSSFKKMIEKPFMIRVQLVVEKIAFEHGVGKIKFRHNQAVYIHTDNMQKISLKFPYELNTERKIERKETQLITLPLHIFDRSCSDKKCTICYIDMTCETSVMTACGHFYHKECINKWLIEKKICPTCRKDIRE